MTSRGAPMVSTAWPTLSGTSAWHAGLGIAAGLMAGLVAASGTGGVLLALAVLGVAAGGLLALRRPVVVFAAMLGLLVFVPFYAVPEVRSMLIEPASIACLTLAAAHLITRRAIPVPTAIDYGVGALLIGMLLAALLGPRTVADLARLWFLWVPAFIAGRTAVQKSGAAVGVARWIAAAGAVLFPFVLAEAITGDNLFFRFSFNAAQSHVWAHADNRLHGGTRPEVSFGHPVALSMFLATSALCAAALALEETARGRRLALIGAAGAAMIAMALTGARTGWVVLIVGGALIAIRSTTPQVRRRLGVAIASTVVLFGALLAVAPREARTPVSLLSDGGDAALAASTDYRRQLLRRALEHDALSVVGNAENRLSYSVQASNGSVDSQYLFLADQWGLVSLAGILALVASLGVSLFVFPPGLPRYLVAIALANAMGLWSVALVTQQNVLFFLIVGAASGAALSAGARHKAAEAGRYSAEIG